MAREILPGVVQLDEADLTDEEDAPSDVIRDALARYLAEASWINKVPI